MKLFSNKFCNKLWWRIEPSRSRGREFSLAMAVKNICDIFEDGGFNRSLVVRAVHRLVGFRGLQRFYTEKFGFFMLWSCTCEK